jgi:hypothetical protein
MNPFVLLEVGVSSKQEQSNHEEGKGNGRGRKPGGRKKLYINPAEERGGGDRDKSRQEELLPE